MPNPRVCMLGAVLFGALPSCGGGTPQTCLATIITYTGSKSGTTYIKVVSDDGKTYSDAGSQPSIQALMVVENSGVLCFGRGDRTDIPITGAVWIDVAGTSAANCSPSVLSPQCQPAPTDPQGHQTGVIRFGQTTSFRIDVVDPP
jgi:hypothetical protein